MSSTPDPERRELPADAADADGAGTSLGSPTTSSAPAPTPSPALPPTPTSAPEPEGRRTSPITPLATGWRIVAVVVVVVGVRHISDLAEDFTWGRLLIALAVLLGIVAIGTAISALSWWRTTYVIAEDGVTLRSGLVTRSRRTAPREKIESVSIERPLVARLLGLSKVIVEIAGGSESKLEIAFVSVAEADDIRRRILEVASGPTARPAPRPGEPHSVPDGLPRAGQVQADQVRTAPDAAVLNAPAPAAPDGSASPDGPAADAAFPGADDETSPGRRARLRSLLYDDVTDGVLIAEVPTSRLLGAMARDIGFVLGLAVGLAWAIAALVLSGFHLAWGIASLAVIVPVIIYIPRSILGRLETGWGFVSRLTLRGLRKRRGLLSTRTDNVGPGRVQALSLRQPVLWRRPGWTQVDAVIAGMSDDDEDGSESNVLPVGTDEETERTIAALLPALGAPVHDPDAARQAVPARREGVACPADAAPDVHAIREGLAVPDAPRDNDVESAQISAAQARLLRGLLASPARALPALRPVSGIYWIGIRTRAVVVLEHAVVIRSGVLAHVLQVVPRDRIQSVELGQGPLQRRVGGATVTLQLAGTQAFCHDLPLAAAERLAQELAHDAATGHRYSEREHWPLPLLEVPGEEVAA